MTREHTVATAVEPQLATLQAPTLARITDFTAHPATLVTSAAANYQAL